MTMGELYAGLARQMPSAFEARQLFAFVSGLKVHDLPHHNSEAVSPETVARCQALCCRRREGEPLQYLLEEWEFYGLPFFVGPGVLIPRADTELLVDVALGSLSDTRQTRILDLCSGSGCVAIALAHHLPGAQVTAVERELDAFGYLLRNNARHGDHVRPVRADVTGYQPDGLFHLIAANPPYIPTGELPELQQEVRYEPAVALDGGADGLDFYRLLAVRCRDWLEPGGCLCLEMGAGQSEAVSLLLREAGFGEIALHKDLCGVERVACGR